MNNKKDKNTINIYINSYIVPSRGTKFSPGIDIPILNDIVIEPYQTVLINTGIIIVNMPSYFCGLLTIRSSQAKRGITLANGLGIIDPDFKDEVCLLLKNNTEFPSLLIEGERIAQIVIIPTFRGDIKINQQDKSSTSSNPPIQVDYLSEKNWIPIEVRTNKRTGGFGSTN
jgi:dUTP pyrophosphatase